MSQSYTPPSTIAGISRLAKAIRRERGIKHMLALEAAAKIAGFENFKHAKRQLSFPGASSTLQSLYLTVYWDDRDSTKHSSGRCTAEIRLPQETVNALESLKTRGYWMLGGFQLESADHLQARLDASSQDRAKKRITDAIRELQFTVATGFRRMRKMKDIRRINFLQDLPGRDHMSLWVDGMSGSWLALDEPYGSRYSSKESERGQWLAEHGLVTTGPAWEGLYLPGSSIPYFVSNDLDLLQRTSQVVECLGPVPTIDWDTHSGAYESYFHSPQRISSGKPYRPRPQPSYGKRAGALPYGGRPGEASEWRPAEPMSLKQHHALGIILRGLAWSDLSGHSHNRLSTILSTLDDWATYEHVCESSTMLNDLYYGDERANYLTLEEQSQGLGAARSLILSGYNECRPRRDIMKVLDAVERDAIRRAEKRLAKA